MTSSFNGHSLIVVMIGIVGGVCGILVPVLEKINSKWPKLTVGILPMEVSVNQQEFHLG
jgi:hypothetical protein